MTEAIISPEAIEDIGDIRGCIAMDNPETAERVMQAIKASGALLAAQPELGQNQPLLRGVRVWVITEFPSYLMFYREHEGSVEIVRVLQSAGGSKSIFE